MRRHDHRWLYPHLIYEGRRREEIGVVRYCRCGVRQMAFTADWRTPPKSYDLSDIEEEPPVKGR